MSPKFFTYPCFCSDAREMYYLVMIVNISVDRSIEISNKIFYLGEDNSRNDKEADTPRQEIVCRQSARSRTGNVTTKEKDIICRVVDQCHDFDVLGKIVLYILKKLSNK